MSRIIKANFQPIMDANGHRKRQVNQPVLIPTAPENSQEQDPAAAIVDAAAVMRTVEKRATELMKQAEERVVELMTAAEEQATQLGSRAYDSGFSAGREAGYEEGYALGHKEGVAAAQAAMGEEMALVLQVAGECQSLRAKIIAQAERDIVVLSLAIAERIIKEKVENNPDITIKVVRDVVSRLQNAERGVVRVHPSILEAVGGSKAVMHDYAGFELVGDASVEPGGCLVETEFGRLDARLDTRFLDTSQAILGLLEGDTP